MSFPYRITLVALGLVTGASLFAGSGCANTESATNLITHGPPMILQVRMREDYLSVSGSTSQRRVFAFGTHPQADPSLEHHVTSADLKQNDDTAGIRVIMGSLLVGNYLEEIQCRGVVGPDGAFDKVPLGATPDDIAKCAVTNDELPQTCKGPHAVCLCQLDNGCNGIAKGKPVGVLDEDLDGAADAHQLMPNAVGIQCTGKNGDNINVPIDLAQSYWYPSGDQQPPAEPGEGPDAPFDSLGPAIVLHTLAPVMNGDPDLPSSATCGLKFSVDVVGKNNLQVCAPPNGRPTSCAGNIDRCNISCTPGDVSAFSFETSPMTLTIQGISDGQTGVSRTFPVIIQSNTDVDPSSIGAIQVLENGSPYSSFSVMLTAPTQLKITWTAATGLAATTNYTIVLPTGIQDAYHQPLPAAQMVSFTTGN